MLRFRVVRFSIVGLMATLIHGLVLFVLSSVVGIANSLSNLSGFIIAFVISVNAQQTFTFVDRLQKQRLNARAVSTLFAINAAAAFGLGGTLHGWHAMFLPLVPAGINYILFFIFTGLPSFKSQPIKPESK